MATVWCATHQLGAQRAAQELGSADGISAETTAFIKSFNWPSDRDDGAIVVARAPGRLDVMGGIADYSGAFVLQLPLREGCYAAVRRSIAAAGGSEIVVTSRAASAAGRGERVSVPLSELVEPEAAGGAAATAELRPISWEAWARLKGAWHAEQQWAAYVVGGLLALMHAGHVRAVTACADPCAPSERAPTLCVSTERLELLLSSEVPEGKGVSSSAAIEVATLSALAHAFSANALVDDPSELALCAQLVENRAVGAPCGVMDQMASAAGRKGQLMALLCQPAKVEAHVPLPPHIRLWGIDSGVRHSVGGSDCGAGRSDYHQGRSDYGTVRASAFIGKALLNRTISSGGSERERTSLLEYAVDLAPSELDRLAETVLVRLTGAAFLADHPEGHGDRATHVDLSKEYAPRAAVSHPIREHARVELFHQLLLAPSSERQLRLLGEAMYQSHESYGSVGLGSGSTDLLVRMVRRKGAAAGLYGAKITGGGSGGTVCVLTDDSARAEAAVREIAAEYGALHLEGGGAATLFEGSSQGAAEFGALLVRAVEA
jgi:L-arabinokinase